MKILFNKPKYLQIFSLHAMEIDERQTIIDNYNSEIIEGQGESTNKRLAGLTQSSEDLKEGQNTSLNNQAPMMRAIGNVAISIDTLEKKVDNINKKKEKSTKLTTPLRDPIYRNHYTIFMENAGNHVGQLKEARRIQIRLVYFFLYAAGLRLNETKILTKADILSAILTGEVSIVHNKTSSCKFHVIPEEAQRELQAMIPEVEIFFDKYEFLMLGCSKRNSLELYTTYAFINLINDDLKGTCEKYNFLRKYSSHSFRAGYIIKLLRVHTVQDVAQMVGHSAVSSTMKYHRYVIDKTQMRLMLKQALDKEKEIETEEQNMS